jgi:lipopolysaccharide transport system ATP-binding protein
MAKTVIQVEEVWKRYRLGVIGATTLRDELKRLGAKLRNKEDPTVPLDKVNHLNHKAKGSYVWALQNINLEIKEGEVIGIIGNNGAGKSTLLKILSKITAPTSGCVKIKGRMASLLEVGTGMHPELTGIENIYLNGAILGMSRREIKEKLDDIIDFAGIAKYADTPVKRYSSGMGVRLGFAVAAFLEADILVVDEVLAVGDVEFQKRAVGKMKEMSSRQGRTVLFVSHNMASIQSLCQRGILLHQGKVAFDGPVTLCIEQYMGLNNRMGQNESIRTRTDREGDGRVRFTSIELLSNQSVCTTVASGAHVTLRLYYTVNHSNPISDYDLSVNLYNSMGEFMGHLTTMTACTPPLPELKGSGYIDIDIPKLPLSEGIYRVDLYIASQGQIHDYIENAYNLLVSGGSFYGTERNSRPYWYGRRVLIDHRFVFPTNGK